MQNDIYTIPNFLTGKEVTEPYIHFYSADKTTVKNKVMYDQYMICFMLEGTKEVFAADSSIKTGSSEIIFLKAGSVLMSESATVNNRFESILLFFNDAFLDDFCSRHKIELLQQTNNENNFKVLSKDDFLRNFQTSLLLLRNSKVQDLMRLKVEELLLYLYYQHEENFLSFFSKTVFSAPESLLRKVVASYADRYLTIEELAFLCNMSSATFKRHFKKVFNSSPKKYFTEHRMLKAKQLLNRKKAASEIYQELGYESLSSFSSEFKKHVGLSPRQYQVELS